MAALPEAGPSPTVLAIDAAVAASEVRDFDHVVRASSLGKPCERHLFYRFRWAHQPESFSGRMLRLFGTGHAEEARLVEYLRMAGLTVEAVDPATGEQFEVVAVDGHFKGHTDGKVTGVIEAPVTVHLLECKTHNAKSFAQLVKHGVAIAKPEHVAQMQVYMHLQGLERALYVALNKDTSELHIERVRYDAITAMQLLEKAERIKRANVAPPKVADDPDNYQCRFCPSADICHHAAFALRNCRTCLNSSPVAGGAWRCALHDIVLSIEEQKRGCGDHRYLPTLVPGEQIDAIGGEHIEAVVYRMHDGAEWRDGGAT